MGAFLAREDAMVTWDLWVLEKWFQSFTFITYIWLAHHCEVKNTINTTSFAKSVVVRSTTVQGKFPLNFLYVERKYFLKSVQLPEKFFLASAFKILQFHLHQIAMEMETKLVNIYQQFALKLECGLPKRWIKFLKSTKKTERHWSYCFIKIGSTRFFSLLLRS